MLDQDKIQKVNIEQVMQSSYIDYSMSVIVARALPDVRDGLKPVHRRILYGMERLNNTHNQPYKKCARIVGEVLGKYHPHGDSSVYFALARMAQDWSLRYCMVDGQGNFGSIDGDSPAAMRYTEARLSRIAEEMLADINKRTVDFSANFDNTLEEPTVLPTRIPQLLVNGASGIAVGMATNMPPHNLTECINASIALIDNPEAEVADLMQYVKAPDFPTGATIYGYSGVKDAFETGRGRIIVRAKAEIENDGNRESIIVNEIPYGVNKAELIKNIADLVEEKRLDGISNINDESDRSGMRIVIDIKRDSNASVVLNKLYKMTALQSSFSVNNIALVNGRPQLLNLKQLLQAFIDHRHEVVIRRTQFDLEKAEERAHILEGLIIASDNIDEVIAIIRSSQNGEQARTRLMERFALSDKQAAAIVEMRLRQLTGLEQDKLHAEFQQVEEAIRRFKEILSNHEVCMQVIKDELNEVKEKYGDERRTDIVYASEEFNAEDFYADDEMIITISHMGYIKRTPLTEFRAQGRGGVGAKGSDTRDEDFIEYIYPASMHSHLLFFTKKGLHYRLRVYEIPPGAKNAKGRAIQNILNIAPDDAVNAVIKVKDIKDTTQNLIFATKQGIIKKTKLVDYSSSVAANGVKAIIIREDDQLVSVELTDGNSEVIMANRNGRAIRFHESKVRQMGRVSTGVRGMALDDDKDEIVGMICMNENSINNVMVISEKGYGKRSLLEDYRITNRGGKGVKTLNITDKTGDLVAIKSVNDDNDLVIINKSGITLRMKVNEIRVMGRATQGVRLINLEKRNDDIASVCCVDSDPEVEEVEGEELLTSDVNPETEVSNEGEAPAEETQNEQ